MREDKVSFSPSGVKIAFNEEGHRYWSTFDAGGTLTGEERLTVYYESVTTALKKVSQPFDEQGVAQRVATRDGKTVEQVIAGWRANRDAACRFGTRVHSVAEDVLRGQPIRTTPESERERAVMAHAWQCAMDIKNRMRVTAVEQIVFSIDFELAGQIDLAAWDTTANTLWIFDWKTNKEIRTSNQYGVHLLAPLDHLDDCEFIRYGLQLSMYERILKHEAYISRATKVRRAIIHVTEEGARMIELPDMQTEVLDILLQRAITVPF